ncbi:MAG: histidine kinase [Flavobacteriaceae bacterium]|nr:histidine kinase [Flavobacteriaceae bacterium]
MKSQPRFIDRILKYRWISHILFWILLMATFTLSTGLASGTWSHVYTHTAMLPAQIAAAYVLNYVLVPKFLYKKKYGLFTLYFVLSIYFFTVMARLFVVHIAEPLFREDYTQESIGEIMSDAVYLFAVYFPAVFMYGLIMLIIKTIKKRFDEKHEIEILQKEKAKNELKFLRGQIQPHFLFNTLNNLYALTLSKSDLAPQVVLKLSELLDFILYQSDVPSIPVEKEIELMQGFIDLETLRYGDGLDLVFEHSVDEPSTPIAPLLLLPLVENAFKHGSSGSAEKSKIHIHLLVQDKKLSFSIFNSKPRTIENNGSSGIGTANLTRQLELNYPNQYDMEAKDANDSYWVKLSIDLH